MSETPKPHIACDWPEPNVNAAPPKFNLAKCRKNEMGYTEYIDFSNACHKAGQKQHQCAICSLFKWPSELCDAGKWEKDHPPQVKHLGGNHFQVLPREEQNPFLKVTS